MKESRRRAVVCALALSSACAADPGDPPKAQPTEVASRAEPDASVKPPISDASVSGPEDVFVPPRPEDARVDAPVDAAAEGSTSCATCALKVLYRTTAAANSNKELRPHYKIRNDGNAPQPLRELTVRYWYSADGDDAQDFRCDYAKVDCSNVQSKIQKVTPARARADFYLELSFGAGAGSIAAADDSGEIQNALHHTNYADYDQTNDYSFDGAKAQFGEWDRVTLYRNGVLVWGVEP